MGLILLTQSNGVLRPLALLLGWLMNLIYTGMSHLGVNSVGITIIIFTVVIYLFLMPLTYQQQKFSKMSMIMNPELQAIQKKYKNRRDQEAATAMNEETRAVYKKYGVSPSGSCVYLLIQIPILFALYRVIYNVPAYISSVKNTFMGLATQIYNTPGSEKMMKKFLDSISTYATRGTKIDYSTATTAKNSIIDVLDRCTSANWDLLKDTFSNISTSLIDSVQHAAAQFNNFLGVSIVYSPRALIGTAVHEGHLIIILIAILIPLFSAATQFLNIRLSPTNSSNNGNGMSRQMKIMNYMMPLYSFILVFFLPVGVGIYWITGALIRSLQQWIFNRRLDKMDLEALVEKNQKKNDEKLKKAIEKKGVSGQTIAKSANINTKNIDTSKVKLRKDSLAARANAVKNVSADDSQKSADNGKENASASDQTIHYKKGSLAAKANLVNEFNNRNTKKKK